jgi:Mrp family chromosome partitioning ATPase
VKALAEIPARSPGAVRAGTLGRYDLEAYGALLEEVRGNGPVLVTGAGEGRPGVSIGLASAAAAQGIRTALVECDLGSPSFAAALGLAESPGLREYIEGEIEARGTLQPLVLAGPASARATAPLICIVAGEPAEDAEALLGSEDYRHAIAKLASAYDLLVLNGPPLGEEAALEHAAEGAGQVLACVGPALASGRGGRKLRRALRRLPARESGVVVYG